MTASPVGSVAVTTISVRLRSSAAGTPVNDCFTGSNVSHVGSGPPSARTALKTSVVPASASTKLLGSMVN